MGPVKKALAVLVLVAAVVGGTFFYLKRSGPAGPSVSNPFAVEYKRDSAAAEGLVDGDTLYTLVGSGRFYSGAHSLPGGGDREFEEARRKKVEEALRYADEIDSLVQREAANADRLRGEYLNVLQSAVEADRSISAFASASFRDLARLKGRQLSDGAAYRGFAETKGKDPYSQAMVEELAAYRACSMGIAFVEYVGTLASHASAAYHGLSQHKDANLKALASKLDNAMGDLDELANGVQELSTLVNKVRFCFQQLETADHYYALAFAEHLAKEIPKLKKALASAKPREGVAKADLEFCRVYLGLYEKWQQAMAKHLKAVKPDSLVAVAPTTESRPGMAFADGESSSYPTAYGVLSAVGSGAYSLASSAASFTWNGVKTAGKTMQQGAHFSAEYAGLVIKRTRRFWGAVGSRIAGDRRGNSIADLRADFKEWEMEFARNVTTKAPKQTTLRTAKEYLDSVEKGAEKLGKSVGSVGGDAAGWVMGKTAKVVAGTFVSFGKGAAALADPGSSTSELVEGGLDVGLSMIGGSKVLIKGSQVPGLLAGAGEEARAATKLGVAYLQRRATQEELSLLRRLLPTRSIDDILGLLNNKREIISRLGGLEALEASIAAMKARMKAIVAEGAEAWAKSAKETIKSSWDDTFKKQLGGMLDALQSALGGSKTEIFDNVFGGVADDVLKDKLSGLLEETSIEDIAGQYKGTLTFTKFDIPDKLEPAPKSSGDDGCGNIDLSVSGKELAKALLDKPLPVVIVISVRSGTGGMLKIVSPGQKGAQALPFTYEAGELRLTATQQGATTNLTAQIAEKDGKLVLSGTMSASSRGATAEATLEGSKPAPPKKEE